VVSPDGTQLYVAYSPQFYPPDRPWDAIAVIDIATKAVVQTIEVDDGINLGLIKALAINPAGTRLYTSIAELNEVEVIDIATASVVARVDMSVTAGPNAFPWNITVSPDGAQVYVANNANTYPPPPGKVSVIDAGTNTVVHTIDTDPYPDDVAFSPDGSKAYILTAGDAAGTMQTVNTADWTVTATVVVGYGPTSLAVSPDGERVYVVISQDSSTAPAMLRTIDTTTNTIVAPDDTPVGERPAQVRLNASGDRAYVVNHGGPASMTVLDTTVHTDNGLGQVATIPVGLDLNAVALVSCASSICDTGPHSTQLFDPAGVPTNFGASVDISGNTAVVGTGYLGINSAPGAAYVYVKSNGKWTLQATLHPSDGQVGDRFGEAVAISGKTVVVGASAQDSGSAGSAYVFVRNGTTWSEQAHLTASDGVGDNRFGISVGVDANRIVVGADASSSAYVFERAAGVWSEKARLKSSDTGDNGFGVAVAISGGTIAVTATGQYNPDEGNVGAAYVFTGSGRTWSQRAKLTSGSVPLPGQFGWSVDIDKSRLVVGSPHPFDAVNGSAFVFVKAGGTWAKQAQLTASDTTCVNGCGDEFGWSVSISNRTVMVGAPWADIGDRADKAGTAYIFEQPLNGTTWPEKYRIVEPINPRFNKNFGFSVAIAGTNAVVGAPAPWANPQGLGSTYMFSGLI
jgi:YVTN family beta-propeller protein